MSAAEPTGFKGGNHRADGTVGSYLHGSDSTFQCFATLCKLGLSLHGAVHLRGCGGIHGCQAALQPLGQSLDCRLPEYSLQDDSAPSFIRAKPLAAERATMLGHLATGMLSAWRCIRVLHMRCLCCCNSAAAGLMRCLQSCKGQASGCRAWARCSVLQGGSQRSLLGCGILRFTKLL